MRSVGMPEFVILVSLATPCVVVFFLWKYCQILSRIKDEIAGIRRVLERDARTS